MTWWQKETPEREPHYQQALAIVNHHYGRGRGGKA